MSRMASADESMSTGRVPHPGFAEAFRFWLKLGFISFGGPGGQIAIMHAELVERKKWISESRFLHALNYCMLLPGPEAQQLAIYVGWLLHRTWGGIVAGALFVLPSAFILWALKVMSRIAAYWARRLDRGYFLRVETGGDRNRRFRGDSHRKKRAEKRGDDWDRSAGFREPLFFQCSVSRGNIGGGDHRPGRRAGAARQICS